MAMRNRIWQPLLFGLWLGYLFFNNGKGWCDAFLGPSRIPSGRRVLFVDDPVKEASRRVPHGAFLGERSDDNMYNATKSAGFWNRMESLLWTEITTTTKTSRYFNDNDDPKLLLANFENLWEFVVEDPLSLDASASSSSLAAANSLTHFLETWARVTLQNDKGLTTPVSGTSFQVPKKAMNDKNTTERSEIFRKSMKLVFRPPKRYLSYKEQKDMEKGVLPDRKGAKVDAWSPGGIELTVFLTSLPTQRKVLLELTAHRCDIDGDTVVKKTTERAIVRRLEDALSIWKKSRAARNKFIQ